ncbi:MAG: NERD domain-containing protein [Candidatus Hodarchaeota archaeon]
MKKEFSISFLTQFFSEIYSHLRKKDENVVEIWLEVPEINTLKAFDNYELIDFLNHFESISITKGNYINYIVIDKILFITESFNFLNLDIQKLSDLLDFNGFEALIKTILQKNGYKVINNFRFSDNSDYTLKTKQKRYEIDVIGFYNNQILIIDAKQWRRKDSYSAINKAADLQLRRAIALKKNPDIFSSLISRLLGRIYSLKSKLPFLLIPVMVTLEDNSVRISENNVPLVGIYHFNSFLQELRINLQYFNIIKLSKIILQKQLL